MKTMSRKFCPNSVSIVNFEGMNRIPPINGLQEVRGEILQGMENVWYEYVPTCYQPGQALPLVVQLHGGGGDGKRWASITVWHEMAEREGLIVIYPNSPEFECWTCISRDIQYLYDLIEHICCKYSIDRSRIYMQGMSNGDQMTLAFTMAHPEVLAAAGYATGPSDEETLDGDRPAGALPIIQMRGEKDIYWNLTPDTPDIYENRYHMNDLNREIWEDVNGTQQVIPKLSIQGKDNFLIYEGKYAPIINWEIADMGHREPVHGAQVFWDKLYSGCRRVDGKLITTSPKRAIAPDEHTVVLSMGSNLAYSHGKLITIGQPVYGVTRIFAPAEQPHFCLYKTDEMCETETICAPVTFFNVIYGAEITCDAAAECCTLIFPDGRQVKLRSQSVLYEDNGVFCALQKPCVSVCGSFYVPVGELCQLLFGSYVTVADDVLCISDHYAQLGRYTARILRGLLGGMMRPRKKD